MEVVDPKKQELNPELKQIYERVMNTQVADRTAGPQAAVPPVQPQAPAAQSVMPQAPTSPPAMPQTPAAPQTSSGPSTFPGTAARPVAEPAPFVFKGGKAAPAAPAANAGAKKAAGGKGIINGKIIAVLVVILLVVWTVVCAKFVGLF